MLKMNLNILFVIAFIFASINLWGLPTASLPAGFVFPTFSNAGLVNPAAMALDWRTEIALRYSPPLSSDSSQNYLGSLGFSNARWAFNLGYTGSYQDKTALHGAFGSASIHLWQLALGVSARKPEVNSSDPIEADVSADLKLNRKLRVAGSVYNLAGEKRIALGAGIGFPQKATLAADVLFPLNSRGKSITDQWAATVSGSRYFESFGFSMGIKYSRQEDGFNNEGQISGYGAWAQRLGRSLNLTLQYQACPHAMTAGLVWLFSPSPNEYIRVLIDKDDSKIK